MEHTSIQEKILKHLNGLNDLDQQTGSDNLIDTLAERYDAPRNVVEQVIAEWSAGRTEADDNDEEK
tara:strand:+ start:344 stop:541 length:198 start_codon:yes stop_codon:yes gene_type:complete